MRREIEDWWRQAKADLGNAEMNLNNKAYYVSVFLSHQAVEKALKALYIKKFKREVFGHRIASFARELNVPEKFMGGIKELNPEWIITRYPNAAGGPPVDLYTENLAKRHLKTANEILRWIGKQIEE